MPPKLQSPAPYGSNSNTGVKSLTPAQAPMTPDMMNDPDFDYQAYLRSGAAKGEPLSDEAMWALWNAQHPNTDPNNTSENALRPENDVPIRTPRPMRPDPEVDHAAQIAELKKQAALFHAGQMNQINYGQLTPASQQILQDYMAMWGNAPGVPQAGVPRTMNPYSGQENRPPEVPPNMHARPGRYGTRPPH